MEELERIPLIRKIAAPVDIMELDEIEDKICQYCKLWKVIFIFIDKHLLHTELSEKPNGV